MARRIVEQITMDPETHRQATALATQTMGPRGLSRLIEMLLREALRKDGAK
jgi:hypothetical protein